MRGAVVHDLAKKENAVAASAFDTGTVKYGMVALDKRNDMGAPSFAEWWERALSSPAAVSCPLTGPQIRYAEARARHAADEARRANERTSVEQRYALEKRELRVELMVERRTQAGQLATHQRRLFYAEYNETIRRPKLARLRDRQTIDLISLSRKKMPSFATWKRNMVQILAEIRRGWDTSSPADLSAIPSLNRMPALATIPSLRSVPSLASIRHNRLKLPGVRLLGDVVGDAVSTAYAPIDPAVLRRLNNSRMNTRFEHEVTIGYGSLTIQGGEREDPIDGYHPKLIPGGVKYARRGEAPAFVEKGALITVKIDSDDALRAALKLALKRTTGPIVIHADRMVLDRIRNIADALGIADRLIDGAAKAQGENANMARPEPLQPKPLQGSVSMRQAVEATAPTGRIRIFEQDELANLPTDNRPHRKVRQPEKSGLGTGVRATSTSPNDEDADFALQQAMMSLGKGKGK